ncbi:MAG: outer membrane lipoprotein-sorting protein [Terracidiphilus sp.]
MRFSSIALVVALLCVIPSSATDVKMVLAASRQRIETADYRASGHLIRVDANGNRFSFPVTIKAHWFPGVLRVYMELGTCSKTSADSLVRSHAPTHILLEMRPNKLNVVQIAHRGDATAATLPFERWGDGPLGAEFSYEDFLEAQYFWAGQMAMDKAKFGARDCDVVKSTPGATDKTHYAEVTTWFDHGAEYPVYAEKTLKGGTVKEFTYFGLRQNGGVWSAHQVEAKIRGQAGSVLLIIDRGTPKANLSMKDFSSAQLTHF